MNTERKSLSMDDIGELDDFRPRTPRPAAVEAEKRAVEAMASFPSREATLGEDQLNIKGPKPVLDRFRALRKAERYPYATLLEMLMDAYEQQPR